MYADRDHLCQVLIILLSNAIKFSHVAGATTVTVKIERGSMEFRVADQGREAYRKILDKRSSIVSFKFIKQTQVKEAAQD